MDDRDFNHSDPDLGRGPTLRRRGVRETLYKKPQTKVCYFYKDGDINFGGVRIAINPRRYNNLETLKKDLNGKVKGLPFGVRSIYTPGGHDNVDTVDSLKDNGRYVCSTHRTYAHGVDLARVHGRRVWKTGRPPSGRKQHMAYLSEGDQLSPPPLRPPKKAWKSTNQLANIPSMKTPKKIQVIRNGDPDHKHVLLLNRRTAQNFEQVLSDLGQMFQMRAARLYTLDGRPVRSLSSIFNGPDMYALSRGEPFRPLGAHTDPTPFSTSVTPSRSRRKISNDVVAQRLRDKRDKLARTRGKWKVWVSTNDLPSSGTNAQVFLTVYGHKGNSGSIPLGYGDGSTFQAGNIDEFEVAVGNIGEIFKIRISHDNNGEFPGWFLDEVRMRDVHTDEQLTFKCTQWLDRDQGDHEICRELPVTRSGEPSVSVVTYDVKVETGEVWNGGTDANVYITLYGQRGDTGVRQLLHSTRPDMFKKGNTDTFSLEAVSLGNLKRVIIGHDGTNIGDGWFLEKITVKENPKGQEWLFPCARWLDEGEDDGKIVRELKPQDEYRQDFIEKQMWEFEKWKFDNHNQVLLYSSLKQLPLRIKQDASLDASGDYTDQMAVFNVLGQRGMLRVFQSAANPKFHLAIDNGKVMGHGRGGAYCEFKVHVQVDRSVLLESNKYSLQHINITQSGKAGDPRGVLDDPNKYFFVYCKGIFRDQGVIMLCTSLRQTLNIDENNVLYGTGKRNKLSHFRIHKVGEKNVRMFESVVFPKQYIQLKDSKFDVLGNGDTHCQFKVRKTRDKAFVSLESVHQKGICMGLKADGSVRPTVDTGEKNTRLYPEVVEWGIPKDRQTFFPTEVVPSPPPVDTKPKKARNKKPQKSRATPTPIPTPTPQSEAGQWTVTVISDDDAEQSDVLLIVYGDDGNSGDILLGRAGSVGMFKAGNQDDFKVNLAKVGKIYKVRIELRPLKGKKSPKWKVREVKLKDLTTKEVLRFKFNRWLSQSHGDKDLVCELPAVRPAQEVLPVLQYEIQTFTADVPGAETDANVYITLFGERGDTGKRLLFESNHRHKFQEGQVDTFHLSAVSLASVQRVLLSHDGDGPGEGWMCERVVVKEGRDSEKVYVFPCDKWMDTSIDDGKLERLLKVQAVDTLPVKEVVSPKPQTPPARSPTPVARSPTPQETQREPTPRPATPPAGEYTVWVTTGQEAAMATHHQVVLVAYGNKDVSSEVELGRGIEAFGKGVTHEVKVNFNCDLGELYKVRVGLSEASSSSSEEESWYLEKLKLKDEHTQQLYMFKVNRWLSRLQDDLDVWRELAVVLPGKKALPVVIYTVEIQTGSRPGADTDADIFIKLVGRRGDTGKRLMYKSENNKDKFQSGQLDIFKLEAVTLEEVTQVWLGHSEKGKGAGWYCDHVTVREGPHPEAEVYHFPCYQWLDQGMEDRKIERLLERGEPPKDSRGQYTVYITTAADSKPPNGSSASITLYGSKSQSRDLPLSASQPAFLPGSVDEFTIEVGELGDLYKIRIAREFGDQWEGWHLEEVRLVDKDTKKETHFHCGRWLDLYDGDHHIVREMAVVTETDPLAVDLYEVHVYTGDHWAADTDADVYLTLYGQRGDTGRRYLTHSENSETKFRRNQVDTFLVEAVTLDQLEKLTVGHTGQGHGAGWFLEKIIVRQKDVGEREWLFTCDHWLDDHEGDRKTERDLILSAHQDINHMPALPKEGSQTQGKYEVRITTSDLQNATTHAQVAITVCGEKGNSRTLPLGSSGPETDHWERGQVYTDMINVGDIGDVTKIRLEHDNTHSFPSWHVHKVELTDSDTGQQLIFPVNRWLSESEEDGALCRELPVRRPGVTPIPVLRYYVATYTANVSNAATTANVFVSLFGDLGDSGKRPLSDSLIHQVKFLQGQIDVFTVECVSLGNLERVCVSHDGADTDCAWFLDQVIIKESLWAVTQWSFPCSQWIEHKSDGQSAEVALVTKGAELYRPLPSHELGLLRPEGDTESGGDWTVWTTTGHHDGPPTNTQISLVLCGTTATSEAVRLQGEDKDTNFLPGKEDQFEMSVGEIGEVLKVRLSLDILTPNPSWLLDKVKLKNKASGQEFHMDYGKWVKKEPGDTQLIVELPAIRPDIVPLTEKTYLLSVTTGTEIKSDTQANVYCDLIGPYGDAGKRQLTKALSQHGSLFQKGQTDQFEIHCLDLGPLSSLVVGHDRFGRGKGWFCEQVAVTESTNPHTQTVFPCHQWLDTGIGDRSIERTLKSLVKVPVMTESDPGKLPESKGMYKAFVSSAGLANSDTGGNTNNNNSETDGQPTGQVEFTQCTVCGLDWLVCDCDVLVGCPDNAGTAAQRVISSSLDCVACKDTCGQPVDSVRCMATACSGQLVDSVRCMATDCSGQPVDSMRCTATDRSFHLNCNNSAGVSEDDLGGGGGVVSLMVYGQEGVAGPIELDNGDPDMFSPGKQDEFDLHVGELGELYKIRVTHALPRPWCLQRLLLQDVHTKEKLTFDFSQFVGQTAGDIRKELPVVRPGAIALPVLQYRVTLVTDNQPVEAEHTPDVFIRLFGERGDSGSRHLNEIDAEGASGLIKPNYHHTFILSAVDLMTVNKVVLTKGRGASLHIQQVRIKQAEFAPVEWCFPYNGSIADNEFSVKIEVDLVTMETHKSPSALPLEECPHLPKSEGVWQVWTTTGSEQNSGTDAQVQVVMCGEQGESPPISLIPFDTENPALQTGNTDMFMIQLREPVGEIQKVRLGFDDSSQAASWFCDTIRFEDEATKDEFIIDVHDWIKVDEESDGWREFSVPWPGIDPTPMVQYIVEVHTGDRIGADTQATVYLTLYGNLGNSGQRSLKKSSGGGRMFEVGGVDRFEVEAAHLGILQMAVVRHNGQQPGDGWYLDRILVQEGKAAQPVRLECDRWLDTGKDDNQIERTLLVSEGAGQEGESWTVTLHTDTEQSIDVIETVVMVICGDQGQCEVLLNDDPKSALKVGQEDTFNVKLTEQVGNVYKIRVGFNDNKHVTWQLAKVRLERLRSGEQLEFIYGDFIVVDEEHDGWTEIPRFYSDPADMLKVNSYQVKIHTKDVHNAGTDANVYIHIFGSHGDTGRRKLKYSHLHGNNKFEQDRVDLFSIQAVDLGQVTSITVGHDDEGLGSGWYLDDISIKESELAEKTVYFKCDRWLDKEKEDGLIERKLEAEYASPPVDTEQRGQVWSVLVRNGPYLPDQGVEREVDSPAPPSGHALLVLYGDRGRSEVQTLTSANPTRFLANQTEQYEITVLEEVGEIYKVRVGYSDEVTEENWPLEYILLQEHGSEDQIKFDHSGFVTKDTDHDGWTEIPRQKDTEQEQICTYQVEVFTSDISSAGTDANVFIEIYGSHGDTGPRQLKKSQTKAKFERNQMDMFDIRSVHLGDLHKVVVWHDGKGIGAGWHLEKLVIVSSGQRDLQYVFQCQRWLDEGEEDGKTEREILLSEAEAREATPWEEGDHWKVWVTSGLPADGDRYHMTSQLTLTLCGEKGSSEALPLQSYSTDLYIPGQTDEFDIRVKKPLGQLYKVRVRFAESTDHQAWLPTSLSLKDMESEAQYLCESGRWMMLDEKQDGVQEIACLTEGGSTLPVVTYQFHVYTADCPGAGTDAEVSVLLTGENGDTGYRKLLHSTTHTAKFEQNQMDTFEIEALHLGTLSNLMVRHNGEGAGAGWFLDQVVVKSSQPQVQSIFPCHRWLDEGEDDGLIQRTLTILPQAGEPWTLSTLTSTERGAGTQGPAALVLYTDKGKSKPVMFGDEPNAKFEDGQTQNFPVYVEFEEAGLKSADIQEIYKVRLILDPTQERDQDLYWFLDQLQLKDLATGRDFVFELNSRVDIDNKNDGQVEIPLKKSENALPVCHYQVEVYTKDESNAGTDANVHLLMCGSRGDTGVRKLLHSETEGNKFESGMRDLFTISAVDLGHLSQVIIGHDGKGIGSGWNLDRVVVKTGVNGKKEFHFPCEKWLAEDADDKLVERELELCQPEGEAWCVTMVTSEGGGTDGPVEVQMFTDKEGCVPLVISENRKLEGTQNFPVWVRCDGEKTFTELGDIYKIRLRLDPECKHEDLYWDLQKVVLENMDNQKSLEFVNKTRVEKTESVQGVVELAVDRGKSTAKVHNYYVEVYTKDDSGAGTDANVHLVLSGSHGDTGLRKLLKSHVDGDKFESGKMDAFVIPAVDLGSLSKLLIGHDGSGFGSGWHLDRVVVKQDVTSASNFVFDCNKVLDDDEKEVELPLTVTLDDPDSSGSELSDDWELEGDWRVLVTTSSNPEAGTSDHVTLTVFGEGGETGPLPLGEAGKGLFQPGQTDEFDVYLEPQEVGELQRLKFTVEDGESWQPEKVVFVNPVTERVLEIPIDRVITNSEVFSIPQAEPADEPSNDQGNDTQTT